MNNPPAFPFTWDASNRDLKTEEGMLLVDYFASKIMNSIVSQMNWIDIDDYSAYSAAKASYDIAKAMLKAREKYFQECR